MSDQRPVVLVYPGSRARWNAQPWCDLPLDLLSVGSPVARAGYDVQIIDQRLDPHWRDRLLAALRRRPVCVGVTSTTGPQLKHALEVSRTVKDHSDVPVVWGGIHATLLPEQTLERPEVDYVVQAEGERTFLELVAALDQGKSPYAIPGVWKAGQGTAPREFIDLNEEPPLEYGLVDVARYTRTVFGVKRLSFSTSRGCVYPCGFCLSTTVHKRRWRAMNADVAVERIREFTRRFNVKGLFLTDPNFFVDLDRAREILEGVVRNKLDVVFTRLHIRFDALKRLSRQDLDLIVRAGGKCLSMGVESGSPRIRRLMHKEIDECELLEWNRRLRQWPLTPLYFFMMGFPTETVQDLRQTVDLFIRLVDENPRASKSLNVYVPYPGTELYTVAVQEGFRPPASMEGWFDFSYRRLGGGGSWVRPDVQERIEMLDFCSFFVGGGGVAKPFKQTNRLAAMAARAYAPVARLRVRHMIYQWPLEARAAKRLGLYAQES